MHTQSAKENVGILVIIFLQTLRSTKRTNTNAIQLPKVEKDHLCNKDGLEARDDMHLLKHPLICEGVHRNANAAKMKKCGTHVIIRKQAKKVDGYCMFTAGEQRCSSYAHVKSFGVGMSALAVRSNDRPCL